MKTVLSEASVEHAEPQLAAVADGLDHVAGEALAGFPDDRCLAGRGEAVPARAVASDPHLVAPEDHRALALGARPKRRIGLLQPAPDSLRVLLVGALNGLLGRKPPTPEVVAERPDREAHREAPRDQIAHRLTRPERERKLQLVRILLADRRHDLCLLERGDCDVSKLAVAPSPSLVDSVG